MRYFIPIGADCKPARILKAKGLRVFAFPFDWIVCPIYTIYKLLSNNFKGFMEDIIILEKDNRILFNENDENMELIVSNTKIYPVIDIQYDILFPHDFYNNDKNTKTTYKLNLLDIDDEDINIPPASFETELTLPSSDFQKLVRDMTNIGEHVEVKSVGSTLMFNCNGDFASQETTLGETQNGLQFSQSSAPETPIQGIFSLKYLLLFTKCTNMCNQIHMYIKNDYPLVIKYAVANLGDIKLCLAPNVE